MTDFDVDREQLFVFPVDDEYLFKYYFDQQDLFDALRDFYDEDEYRFAVPDDEWPAVEERLLEAYFAPVIVEDLEDFCVVKEQYTPHADILRESIVHWQRRGHNFFLMKDELAVAEAIQEHDATTLEDTEFVLGL